MLVSMWVHKSWFVVAPHKNIVLIKDLFTRENGFINEQNKGWKRRVQSTSIRFPNVEDNPQAAMTGLVANDIYVNAPSVM